MQSLEYHAAIERKAPKKNVQSDRLNLSAKNFAHAKHLHGFIELSNENYLLCLQFGTSFDAQNVFSFVYFNLSAPAPPHFGILLYLTPITLPT